MICLPRVKITHYRSASDFSIAQRYNQAEYRMIGINSAACCALLPVGVCVGLLLSEILRSRANSSRPARHNLFPKTMSCGKIRRTSSFFVMSFRNFRLARIFELTQSSILAVNDNEQVISPDDAGQPTYQ